MTLLIMVVMSVIPICCWNPFNFLNYLSMNYLVCLHIFSIFLLTELFFNCMVITHCLVKKEENQAEQVPIVTVDGVMSNVVITSKVPCCLPRLF